jgi:hypothetical protein
MSDIVQKLWGFCHTLRHDGVDYGDYIEQLTYLLFLKMAEERGAKVPKDCDWESLKAKSGTQLTDHYADILRKLREAGGLLADVFAQATPRFNNPVGNAIVLILDKLDDLEKPEMLAKVFAALVRNKINPETFRRLASAIDIGFLEDLKAFADSRGATPVELTALYTNLLRTGLTELEGPRIPSEKGMPKVVCNVTELGRLFREFIRKEPS